MQILVIVLWLIPLAVWMFPRIISAARRVLTARDGYTFALLAIAAAVYAFPSSADKGEPPPPPPTPKAGVIRLYYHAADGRLVPFDAPVRRAAP